ncbi:MAG: hypothetical protein H0T90_05070 [Gemmatimonadales bacterium]|nr:hypothetical protein [Gemmatimonadales bacterium]
MGAAVSFGLSFITATVLLVDLLRAPAGSSSPDLGAPLYLLFAGTLGGIALSAVVAWQLMEPFSSTYRRGGLAVVSAFATVLLMLVCMPVNQLFGRVGLLVLLGIAILIAFLLTRRARRLVVDA